MTHLRTLIFGILVLVFAVRSAVADDFSGMDEPRVKNVQPRAVYGQVVYDFQFIGRNNSERSASAEGFLKSLINSKFGNEKGQYIVVLELKINGVALVSEPIISATWETNRFLFVTTSDTSKLVINRNGSLLENIVVDNESNKVALTVKLLHSNTSSIDLSLFKQLSELSKTSAISGFVPGIEAVAAAYKPFEALLTELLKTYSEATVVDTMVGAFISLDEGFHNQLRYKNQRFVVNLFLKTKSSQMSSAFDEIQGKFDKPELEAVFQSVKSGVGVARAPILQVVSTGSDKVLTNFVRVFQEGDRYDGANLRDTCLVFKSKLASMVTTRDANLVYWAFLKTFHSKLDGMPNGKQCADDDLTDGLRKLGLTP